MTDRSSTIALVAGVKEASPVAALLASRKDIMSLSEASYQAVLKPDDPGGLSHSERAAFAARMATLNQDQALAAHYRDMITVEGDAAFADPGVKGAPSSRAAALLRHIDLLTLSPREAARTDIEALKRAGVSEADIVRLSELIAFVNYQVRVIATLRALGASA